MKLEDKNNMKKTPKSKYALNKRKIEVNEERWRNVLLFRKYLIQQQHGDENTILHALRKLSDSFFCYEKQRSISHPNFIICLKANKYKIVL